MKYSRDSATTKHFYLSFPLKDRAFSIVFATMNIALISHFARQAGISPSVCISLTILTSFTAAVMFRFIYGEVLTQKHWAGMCAIMLSVILIGLNKA